jgi:hypothetical protein
MWRLESALRKEMDRARKHIMQYARARKRTQKERDRNKKMLYLIREG